MKSKKIPLSSKRKNEILQKKILPLAFFSFTFLLSSWLWKRHGQSPETSGEVAVTRVELKSPISGFLDLTKKLNIHLHMEVHQGDPIVSLDSQAHQSQLKIIELQIELLKNQLEASKLLLTTPESDLEKETARVTWRVENLRLDLLTRKARLASKQIELQKLELEKKSNELLITANTVSKLAYKRKKLEFDQLVSQIQNESEALKEAQTQKENSIRHKANLEKLTPKLLESTLSPIRTALSIEEEKLKSLHLQIDQLLLRAPISGKISAIYKRPGEQVLPGDPIVSVSNSTSNQVIAYVRSPARWHPEVGMKVRVTTHRKALRGFTSQIHSIGPQFELIPQSQLRDPTRPEWGIPVTINLPDQHPLLPGEAVEIAIQGQP